jgi:hypothetical protein
MNRVHIALAVAVLAALTATAAWAAQPGPGTSTGTGRVFFPNPVAQLRNENLTDQKDADYAALQPAYKTVTLTDLDGSGFLRGRWANVVSETGSPAYSPTNTFVYNRSQDEFEQVMAYYWATQAQLYIQRLGFGSTRRPVNAESQDIRLNQYGVDNSFWTNHPKDEIRFGKGGVDDAEDAEVILHEYGHAIQDSQVANFGTSPEGGAIGEGFGDYWAVTVSDTVAPNGFDLPCVADWDSVSYTSGPTHCLRRIDGNKHYPEDVTGEVHADGEIWSRALWDIRNALGSKQADTIILEAQFSYVPDTTFAQAAQATVAAAEKIGGAKAAKAVTAAFSARGIL